MAANSGDISLDYATLLCLVKKFYP